MRGHIFGILEVQVWNAGLYRSSLRVAATAPGSYAYLKNFRKGLTHQRERAV